MVKHVQHKTPGQECTTHHTPSQECTRHQVRLHNTQTPGDKHTRHQVKSAQHTRSRVYKIPGQECTTDKHQVKSVQATRSRMYNRQSRTSFSSLVFPPLVLGFSCHPANCARSLKKTQSSDSYQGLEPLLSLGTTVWSVNLQFSGHYVFALWFLLLLLSFFSSPNLSRCRLDVCCPSTHGVALV